MKKYTWEYLGDIDAFFAELCAATVPYKSFSYHKENCFFLIQKSKNCFTLFHHNPKIRNSFQLFLFGKATQNENGVTVTAELRMNLFVRIFMAFWISGVAFALIAFAIARPLWAFAPGCMLLFGILLLKLGEKSSNLNEVIEIMDNICKQ